MNTLRTFSLPHNSRRIAGSTRSSQSLEESAVPQLSGPVGPPPGINERKLMTKIDMRLLPVLCILYLLAFLDRYVLKFVVWRVGRALINYSVNISNAAIFGLKDELNLGGVEYNTALTIFFVPYICEAIFTASELVFQLTSWCQYLKSRQTSSSRNSSPIFGSQYACSCLASPLLSRASFKTTTAFSQPVSSSVFSRLVCIPLPWATLAWANENEHTGMFPGCFYLIAMWYKREEAQKRYSFFFGSTSLAGAFGGLLASAIGKMDGYNGYRGWRWIFILGM